jgi:GT2 family glycosyltransferase
LVIVDDGSTDNSVSVVKRYLDDPRIRLVEEKHKGCGSALRTAIANSIGDIICILDSDDILTPDALRLVLDTYRRNPGLDIVHSQFYDGFSARKTTFTKNVRIRDNTAKIGNFMNVGTLSPLRTFTRRAYDKTSGVEPGLAAAVDFDIMLKLEEVARGIKLIRKPLYWYRYNINGLSSSRKLVQKDCFQQVKREAMSRRARAAKPFDIGIVASACGITDSIIGRFVSTIEESSPRCSYVTKIVTSQRREVFSRSQALNQGVKSLLRSCRVIACTDVDMLIPPGLIDFSYAQATKTGKNVWVICRNIDENEIESKDWDEWLKKPLRGDLAGMKGVGKGSWNAMTAENWIKSGGWNEEMFGWGGEDDEFWARRSRAGVQTLSVKDFALMHVNHGDRGVIRRGEENLALARRLRKERWL